MFMQIKSNQAVFSKSLIFSFQRGSILIGIIVTMVVMAVLGSGMLYMTTTSTFNELVYGSHSESYFVAEAGGRYAKAVIRDAYANDRAKLNTINANQIFTLSNGNKFQIRDWALQSSNPDTITFSSVGIVGSGFMKAERLIAYGVQPANQTGGGGASASPTGPIDFDDKNIDNYPTPVTGGGKVTYLEDGLGFDLNAAAGGAGKVVTVLSNDAWTFPGDYAVQVKTHADLSVGNNRDWHMGLFVNMKRNGTALPYGYGITFFNAWDDSQLTFATPLPLSASGNPIVLFWQNDQTRGLNWIAYAPLNEYVMQFGIGWRIFGSWYLGIPLDLTFPTLLVKVTRNTAYNDIRVYLAGPINQPLLGSGDTSPTNYDTRKAYPKWSSVANSKNEIKWPSIGSWPSSNDYFTLINSDNTSPSAPVPIAKWIKNTAANVTSTTSFVADTSTIAGTSISNAVIRSTIMTGVNYSGVGLFVDPCGGNPHGDFFNLGFQGSSDGSGSDIQY